MYIVERPHTITIYNKYNNNYYKKVLHGVYYYGSDSINLSGKGVMESGNISIIIDGLNLRDYVDESEYVGGNENYTLQKNSRIVLGEGPDVASINELTDRYKEISIFSIDVNVVGSFLDHILISGR